MHHWSQSHVVQVTGIFTTVLGTARKANKRRIAVDAMPTAANRFGRQCMPWPADICEENERWIPYVSREGTKTSPSSRVASSTTSSTY